jgi:hypothetical protein
MPKAKMKFPPIPGETPRAKFENLMRHLFSVGKEPDNDKRESQKTIKQKHKIG